MEKLVRRPEKVANWYLDMSLLKQYWGSDRKYHHTAPINMTYAFREGLRMLAEEGIEQSWARHKNTAEYLWTELDKLGMECHVDQEYRLAPLTTVRVPAGVEAKTVTQAMLKDHNIEIGNGLGELAGKVWRIGLMGHNSQPENVDHLVSALSQVLNK